MGTVYAKDSGGSKNRNIESTIDPCGGADPGKKVNLTGVEARVDKINVEGLQRTKDDIVVDTVQDLFQAQDFQEVLEQAHRVREKLVNLGCFQNIGIFIDTSSGKQATLNGLEVTFFVKELKKISAGVNTMVGNNEGSLVVGMRAPNMFGRGERLQMEYSYGSRRTNNLSLQFMKPLRTKYNAVFTSSIFQHGSDWPWSGYSIVERGILFDLGLNSTCRLRHNFQYEATWRELGANLRSSVFDVREESGHKIKSSLRHILTYDQRDAPIFPTTGSLLRLASEFAGVGGDFNFLKNDVYYQVNFPLINDIVFQATFQGGYIHNLRGEEDAISIHDKLYMGGPMTVRGFHTRGIGPHSDGAATGANVSYGVGLHLYTPLPFRPGAGGFGELFRLHFFGNLGQSKEINFSEDGAYSELIKDLRMSLGAGIALRLGHIARVEFNYVVPQYVQDGDMVKEGFQFGVGLQFL